MPNKTIYISDGDLPLADRAAELAGGLSPAVVEGLKLYLRHNDVAERGFHEVHVVDRTDGVETRKVFHGHQLARLSQSHDGRRIEWTSYLTPKGNLAVVRSEHPDFVAVARGAGTAGPNAGREAAGSWGNDAPSGSPTSPSAGDTRGTDLFPNDLIDLAFRSFDKAAGRAGRSSYRPQVDVDLSYLANSANRIISDLMNGTNDRGRSFRGDGSVAPGDKPNDGSMENSDKKSRKGFGEVVDHRADSAATETAGSTDGSGNSLRVHTEGSEAAPEEGTHASIVRDELAAHHELEVFADLEKLKEAAFRRTKTVPAPFIAATERALDNPETEYLDI